MSAKELPEAADVEHPTLPGQDLHTFETTWGRCFCSESNPHAYVIGDTVEVGTEVVVEHSGAGEEGG